MDALIRRPASLRTLAPREKRRARVGRQCLGELRARADAKLGKDLAEVVLDGVLADEEPPADFRIGEAVAGEARALRLLRGEVASRLDGAFAGVLAGRLPLDA